MIAVREVENDMHVPQCMGCGNVSDTYIHIDVEDIIDTTEGHLILCPTCKAELVDKLFITSDNKPNADFGYITSTLTREIRILEADNEGTARAWKTVFGNELTEKLALDSNHPMAVIYLRNLDAIRGFKRILKAI